LARATRRIAICEDSKAYSAALRKFLERDAELEVVGSYETAEELLAALENIEVDLVTMDLELPGISGLEAIAAIMRERPLPILVISSHAGKRSERTTEALAAGALEAIHKERVGLADPDDVWATALRSRIKRLATLNLKPRPPADRDTRAPGGRPELDRPGRVVAIGASTGGPPALLSVLEALPADYPLPVLVVQHIAPGFGEGLMTWLDARVPLRVRVAEEGAPAGPGVWFAPDDAHLVLDDAAHLRFDRQTHAGAHRPSVDMLFASLAAAVGDESVGVVLTGMGHDGEGGVKAIRAAGGLVIAQDESSSAVFGMPRAAAKAGADLVLPLEQIGSALRTVRPAARLR
jgi:two-component system, chemotaxis family, protein-glutamate methylesterase/glutaminase